MASNTQGKAPAKKAEADKPKRKNLTPAERIAKIEADLAKAKEAATAKDRKRHEVVTGEISKLDEKIKDLTDKRDALVAEQSEIEGRVPELVDSAVAPGEDPMPGARPDPEAVTPAALKND